MGSSMRRKNPVMRIIVNATKHLSGNRRANRNSRKTFYGNIETINKTSRLRRILVTTSYVPPVLQRNDGTRTSSGTETWNSLLAPTFRLVSDVLVRVCRSGLMREYFSYISARAVKWAIGGFEPYKVTGPDGILLLYYNI